MFDFFKETDTSAGNQASTGGAASFDAGAAATNAMTANNAAATAGPHLPGTMDKVQDWFHDHVTSLVDESQSRKELNAGEAQADALLKGRFDQGKDGNISPEDYAKLKENMGKMMAGQGYLQMDTSALKDPAKADEYKQKMYEDLARISQTKSGRELLDTLVNQNGVKDEDQRKMTTLKPNVDKDGNPLGNGEAVPVGGKAGNAHDSEVSFNPGRDLSPEDAAQAPGMHGKLPSDQWMPIRSDVLLYHELVHAKHQTDGTDREATLEQVDFQGDKNKGQSDAGQGVHESEHQAVGLGAHSDESTTENRYRQERADLANKYPQLAVKGDQNMPQRDTYLAHPGTQDAPAPAPAQP